MSYIFYVGHDKWQNEIRVFLDSIETIEEDAGGSFVILKSGRNISLIEPPYELEIRIISSEQEPEGELTGAPPPAGTQ